MGKKSEEKIEDAVIIQEVKPKLAVMVDGGMGRVLCAIPALQQLNKMYDLIVLSGGWLQAYKGSGLHVIPMGLPDQDLILAAYEIWKPEPYWTVAYRKGEQNMVEAWYEVLRLQVPEGPNLPYRTDTRAVPAVVTAPKKVLMVQPLGSGGLADPRSMTQDELKYCVDKFKEEFSVFILGCNAEQLGFTPEDATFVEMGQEISFIKYIQMAHLFIGCDSAGLHIAAAAGVPAVAHLSVTSGVKYYPELKIVTRPGHEDMRTCPRL